MIMRATACAYANIAIIKYWGKHPEGINSPATPSISLTLDKLKTVTKIKLYSEGIDSFKINDKPADLESSKRIKQYLDFWRNKGLINGVFQVESRNNFPTKSGLASSSSGYAALAIGLSAFSTKKIGVSRLSGLARIGSGSAARSITGGLSALPKTNSPTARLLIPAAKIPWGMIICEVDQAEKEIGSRVGMELSRKSSPYYDSWVVQAQRDYLMMLRALKKLDLELVGHIMESNTLSMHACMIATRPSLIYWTSATIDILHAVKRWRKTGNQVYATMDAGPHVILLCHRDDLDRLAKRAARIDGVIKTTKSLPADGASVISWD